MAMAFMQQAIRLLREKWPGAQELAEELFVILKDWGMNGLDGPLIIDGHGSNEPLIQLRNFGSGINAPISILRNDGLFLGMPGPDATTEINTETPTPSQPETSGSPLLEGVLLGIGGDDLTVMVGDSSFTVYKPYKLRSSTVSGPGGVTFVSTGTQSRQASDGTDTEDQVVIPAYVAGDPIYFQFVESSGVYLDMNPDARAWAVDYSNVLS